MTWGWAGRRALWLRPWPSLAGRDGGGQLGIRSGSGADTDSSSTVAAAVGPSPIPSMRADGPAGRNGIRRVGRTTRMRCGAAAMARMALPAPAGPAAPAASGALTPERPAAGAPVLVPAAAHSARRCGAPSAAGASRSGPLPTSAPAAMPNPVNPLAGPGRVCGHWRRWREMSRASIWALSAGPAAATLPLPLSHRSSRAMKPCFGRAAARSATLTRPAAAAVFAPRRRPACGATAPAVRIRPLPCGS